MKEKVPVGVVVQVRPKPNPRYKVLGLGLVVSDDRGVFTIRQMAGAADRFENAVSGAASDKNFDATDLHDARKREISSIALRRGQPGFRRDLLSAYECRCAFTGCDVEAILEAAHIVPYRGEHTNHVENGLL